MHRLNTQIDLTFHHKQLALEVANADDATALEREAATMIINAYPGKIDMEVMSVMARYNNRVIQQNRWGK